jgi:broad specificity phosphatase PhoE
MTTLLLINQPETTWSKEERCEGQADLSLSPIGKKKIHKIGQYYAHQNIAGVLTSSLARDVQAAKILQLYREGKAKRDQRLTNMKMGVLEGKFPEELEGRYPDIWNTLKNNPERAEIPDGESFSQVRERVEGVLQSFQINELFDKTYLVVTHDIIIRVILCIIEKKSFKDMWTYTLDKASITHIEVYPKQELLEINRTEHLYV